MGGKGPHSGFAYDDAYGVRVINGIFMRRKSINKQYMNNIMIA